MSELACWALCCRGAGCLSGLGSNLQALVCRGAGWLSGLETFLLGTVGLGCRLFKCCSKLPPRHCGAGVQAVKAVSEPTSRALLGQGCRLFNLGWNLPPEHCWAGVQGV